MSHGSGDKDSLHKRLMDLAAEGATLQNMAALFTLLPNLEAALRPSQVAQDAEAAIIEHNAGCEASCKAQRPGIHGQGCGYQNADGGLIYKGRNCPHCPLDWKIDFALSPRVAPSQAVECDYTGGWCVRNVCQESKNCQAVSEFVPLVNAAARSHIAPFCLEPREVEALLDWHHMMTDAACQSDQFNAEAEHRTRYRAIEKMRTLAVSTPAPSANGDPRPYGAGFPPSSTEPTWDQLDAIVREHDLKTRSLMDTAELIWRLSAIGEKTDG